MVWDHALRGTRLDKWFGGAGDLHLNHPIAPKSAPKMLLISLENPGLGAIGAMYSKSTYIRDVNVCRVASTYIQIAISNPLHLAPNAPPGAS